MKNIFVTGIGTDVGKTVVSAVLVRALGACYWKPVQAGASDEREVISLAGINPERSFSPTYDLNTPCSPHAAAKIDGVKIELEDFTLPDCEDRIIVEGAGGLHVPLNYRTLIIDLIKHLELPVVLVSRQYLGSINHTLLSIEALKSRKINLLGVVFVGEQNRESEEAILKFGQTKVLFHLPVLDPLTPESCQSFADKNKELINERLAEHR